MRDIHFEMSICRRMSDPTSKSQYDQGLHVNDPYIVTLLLPFLRSTREVACLTTWALNHLCANGFVMRRWQMV